MNRSFLVTGVAGSGKTTLEKVFADKGYLTIDIDNGYAEWRDKKTGQTVDYNPHSADWSRRTIWALKDVELQKWLERNCQVTKIVFGSTNDLVDYLDYFDKVFLLEYSDKATAAQRITSRDSGYGKTPHELTNVLNYIMPYQAAMKKHGAISINATKPLDTIAQEIESSITE